ncbi:MAG: agmatine deiminase family protein, partial [Rhodothermales bacterium]|nr:agmatine deiminase family protein [Rhodothermales bacterium]
NRETWPGAFEAAENAYARLVQVIANSEPVDISDLSEDHRTRVLALVGPTRYPIRTHLIPTNDAWCRDHGAVLVHEAEGGLAAVDFRYNAWGGKYPPFDLDAVVASQMAKLLGARRIQSNLTLEGGAIDVNGEGILLTTASCVLNPNRNPGLTASEAERQLGALLGVDRVIWVEGELEGDDTDGHVDNLARFVGPRDVVMSVPGPSGGDASLAAGFERLRTDGERHDLRVHALPLPPRQFSPPESGEHVPLPASYANFYITNHSVLVPGYDTDADARAVDVLTPFFPDRQVEVVDCRAIAWGLGAVHCLTQQVPA